MTRRLLVRMLKEEIKKRGKITHDDTLRYIMLAGQLGRQTAEKIIQDLIFTGELTEVKGIIQLPSDGEK